MDQVNNSSEEQKKLNIDVKKKYTGLSQDQAQPKNELLYNHIYYEAGLNINQLATKLEVNRQYIWGILHRRILCPIPFAQKICDILDVKNIHTLFRQGDLYYPSFTTANKLEVGE